MTKKAKGPATESTSGRGPLTISAQQSRFHTEASEGTSKETGRHYVLIGRNGTGKSTLLGAIASGEIPSIPRGLNILLLGQTQTNITDEIENLKLGDQSVLQHVLRSDRARERLLLESRDLSSAVDNSSDPIAIVRAYRKVTHRRLEGEVAKAAALAARRSGVRGLSARKRLIELEEKLSVSRSRVDDDLRQIDAAQLEDEVLEAATLLADINLLIGQSDTAALTAKAESILFGLGFVAQSLDKPISHLSGGWKTRCSLACALYQTADLLLLDEPTNYLDLPSIIWLENYINTLERTTTVVVVTHDRAFADAVSEELLILRDLTIATFKGNLSGYELERISTYKYLSRMKDAQERQKKHMQSTIDQNVRAAKRTGDDKKLKQAASRKKKLEERTGMEVSAKGTRFKLNRDLAGYHLTNRDEIEVPTFEPPLRIAFPSSPADLRHPGALLNMEMVSFSYNTGKKATPLLHDINLTIHLGERVGIAGLNGSGKTTLVSLAMGTLPLPATAVGATQQSITRHARARFGLYNQHSVEKLDDIAINQPQHTALSYLLQLTGGAMTEQDARGLLASLGLPGKYASDVPIALLSGGQKVRLALAELLWTPPHLLILDEVTTHLDSDTISALVTALRGYKGAILLVTHDRFFMRCVVEGKSLKSMAREAGLGDGHDGNDDDASDSDEDGNEKRVGRVYRLSKGKLTKLEGGMRQYEQGAEKTLGKLGKA